MNELYIFSVGRVDFDAASIESIHNLGFKAGLFADKSLHHKHTERFDMVVPIDFDAIKDEIHKLDEMNLQVAGLLCTYENYIIAKALLGTHFNVPTISAESAALCTDKALMRKAFIDRDPSISPQYKVVTSEKDLLEFAAKAQYPLIIKPANLVKSLLVMRCDDEEQLINNYTYAVNSIEGLYAKYNIYNREPTIIVEEFITGQMYSLAAFVDSKGTPFFCPGIVKLTTAQQRHIDDNFLYERELPATLEPVLEAKLLAVATKAIAALKMTSSAAHVELIESGGDVKVIEIGARIGGYRPRMYGISYGINMSQLEVQTARDELATITADAHDHVSVFELFAPTTGQFTGLSGDFDADRFHYFSLKVKAGDQTGPAMHGFKAAVVIIVKSANLKEFTELRQMVDRIEVRTA